MRPKLAQGSARQSRKVLVLGPLAVARRIGEQLRNLGYEPTLQEETGGLLPSIADPDGASKLRAALLGYLRSPAAQGVLAPCLHPGISPWAERPELLTQGQELGFSVVSPPPRVVTLFGNKLNLLVQGERLNIPHLLISADPLHSLREIEQLLARHQQNFPFILKSAKGSPGAGYQVVQDVEQLQSKLSLWMEQLRFNCGEVMLLAERYLEGARAITVPFVRFMSGELRIFPMLDSSLQCRYRKLIEFCPTPSLDPLVERKLVEWTEELAHTMGYVGAGSIEFLVDSSRAFLIGGAPRLNASFHLWEQVAGVEAVAWQMAAIEGGQISDLPPPKPDRKWSHGLSIRIYAEDPVLQLPQPGVVRELGERREWSFPSAEARLDLGIRVGERVTQGLLGLLHVGAQDAKQASTVARGVLEELWIAGSLQTNERFISELLPHPWVREGIFHAGFVDEEFLPAIRPPMPVLQGLAGVCAAIEPELTSRWAVGDQWAKLDPSAFKWLKGPELWTEFSKNGKNGKRGLSGLIELEDGRHYRVCAYPLTEEKWQVRLGGWTLPVRRVPQASAAKRRPKILALVSGRVHAVYFREGTRVPAHEPLLVIESLGNLIPHALPVEVRIEKWKVEAEGLIQAGEELADFEIVART